MKVFILLALVAAASAASVDPIDFSKVVPIYELPQFWDKYPQLTKPTGRQGRIVGGEETRPGQFPYMVSILTHTLQGNGFCGGSLLTNEYVLTAAHCIDIPDVTGFTLIFGAHNVSDNTEVSQVRVTPIRPIVHAGWSPSTLQNDIAVFHIPPIELTDRIQTIRLPSRRQLNENFAGVLATASGWGRPSDSVNAISPVLRYVEQPIITNTRCNLRFLGVIQASHICMSGDNGRGTCNGDSGGPLTIMEDEESTQVGVVSFGIAFGCEVGWPGVFSRVTSFLSWIEEITNVVIRP